MLHEHCDNTIKILKSMNALWDSVASLPDPLPLHILKLMKSPKHLPHYPPPPIKPDSLPPQHPHLLPRPPPFLPPLPMKPAYPPNRRPNPMTRHIRRERVIAHPVADGAGGGVQVVGHRGVGGEAAAWDGEESCVEAFAIGGQRGVGADTGEGCLVVDVCGFEFGG
jgi:hypothetical protein